MLRDAALAFMALSLFVVVAPGPAEAETPPLRPPERASPPPFDSDPHAEPPVPAPDLEPAGRLTLHDALALALTRNPELAAFSLEVRAREARTLQAGLLPNPELSVEVENIAGSGTLRSVDGAETTIRIGQLLELAGKRSKRARVASLEQDLAAWEYEARKADVLSETAKAFIGVLEAQERVALAEELLGLAQRVVETVSQRVMAGKVSPVEEIRAGVVLADGRIEIERAKRALDAARGRLAAAWGSRAPAFDMAVGTLENVQAVPPAEELADGIDRNPGLGRWDTELKRRRADVTLQEANRVPDLTLEAGLRDFRETGDRAFVVAGSVPIPLFDRNQGEILAARHRFARAGRERAAAEATIGAALAVAYGELSTAAAEVEALRTAVIPAARSVFDAAGEGYRQGKFGFLEVLDAQRTLFEARGRYLSALAAYGRASADVARAIGRFPGAADAIPGRQ